MASFFGSPKHAKLDFFMTCLELALTLVIVFQIGCELREGRKQINALNNLVTSSNNLVSATSSLQKAQQDSLNTLNESLQTIKQQSTLIKQQLDIQQSQFEAQKKHPVLEVRALVFKRGAPEKRGPWSTQLLNPAKSGWLADMVLVVQSKTQYGEVRFILRNIGTAPAVNVTILPRASQGVGIVCVDYPALSLYTQQRPNTDACAIPTGILPPLLPRPKNRPATMGESGSEDEEFDPDFDVKVRVNLTVPLDIAAFDLELMVGADRLSPTRYLVHVAGGRVMSSSATLTVANADPYIVTQPTNQNGNLGGTVTFSVVASGASTLSYQWKKNGSNIGGATSSSYTTPPIQQSDSGSTYQVVVTDSNGSVSSNIVTLSLNWANSECRLRLLRHSVVQPQSR